MLTQIVYRDQDLSVYNQIDVHSGMQIHGQQAKIWAVTLTGSHIIPVVYGQRYDPHCFIITESRRSLEEFRIIRSINDNCVDGILFLKDFPINQAITLETGDPLIIKVKRVCNPFVVNFSFYFGGQIAPVLCRFCEVNFPLYFLFPLYPNQFYGDYITRTRIIN